MQTIILGILKMFLTEKIVKALAIEMIEAIVEATDNTVDDRLAKPILDVLRG